MAIPLGGTAIHRMAVFFRLALRSGRPRLTLARDVFEMTSYQPPSRSMSRRRTANVRKVVANSR